jgi:hypothetical protein
VLELGGDVEMGGHDVVSPIHNALRSGRGAEEAPRGGPMPPQAKLPAAPALKNQGSRPGASAGELALGRSERRSANRSPGRYL